ncbi:dihydrolipoyl dehydrogenase [Trueperella sp. HMSC08B05]|uniref:Dihydrolipoyl dehydrogenase n=1 Tax=Trueperella bernardiae TaxID=59561 RepID=A0AAW6ZLD6_9ACTO|nr:MULTISPECIES: dihydrolipoyl dehydrogenase [Trueperella]MDK8602293.1 dihydrolipoyl dehydrogenase [Trueperella bernardiae]MDV6238548.1 dihydrolipoyl dehydrogenase [Trueperella bernardiae]OCW61027.1 dihydrolipoamide dehydrogenase [Trueperella bernardiae]OFS68676.1 dihydrolipoyl dehydrogenase [Trueperella sp. HMSC08H06]OFS75943.1 dihydrolipoyl dehydrogenase [Trueperella sp. HMSC08B05]
MTEKEYDVVILGAGSGGYACALRSAQLGMKVALIEGDKVGGTCLHRGCIPTKALLHAAEVADEMREGPSIGVKGTFEGIDMGALNTYKNGVVEKMFKGLTGLVNAAGIDTIAGWGRLVAKDTVEVNGERIKGKNIVLATGSYSKTIGQTITDRVITSDKALTMDVVPSSVIVLGGGVIGCEFASVWNSYGADVTIIEGLDHLVPNEDEDVSKMLERSFRKRKIAFKTKTMFDRVEEDESGVHVFTQDGKQYDAEYLLIAIGRGPSTANLGYEEQGITIDRGFVITNERLHTGVGNIYAVGDIVPGVQLAHRGFLQGLFVADEIAGNNPAVVNEDNIPKVTFSNPEIASVGLSQKKAEEKFGKDNVETSTFNLAGNGKSQMLGTTGFVKLVREKDGPIVGFHSIGARMGEQVGEGMLMVAWESYPEDFDGLIHAHPTQNESVGEAILALAGKPLHTHN